MRAIKLRERWPPPRRQRRPHIPGMARYRVRVTCGNVFVLAREVELGADLGCGPRCRNGANGRCRVVEIRSL